MHCIASQRAAPGKPLPRYLPPTLSGGGALKTSGGSAHQLTKVSSQLDGEWYNTVISHYNELHGTDIIFRYNGNCVVTKFC